MGRLARRFVFSRLYGSCASLYEAFCVSVWGFFVLLIFGLLRSGFLLPLCGLLGFAPVFLVSHACFMRYSAYLRHPRLIIPSRNQLGFNHLTGFRPRSSQRMNGFALSLSHSYGGFCSRIISSSPAFHYGMTTCRAIIRRLPSVCLLVSSGSCPILARRYS